jgi:hypothetical protein
MFLVMEGIIEFFRLVFEVKIFCKNKFGIIRKSNGTFYNANLFGSEISA